MIVSVKNSDSNEICIHFPEKVCYNAQVILP